MKMATIYFITLLAVNLVSADLVDITDDIMNGINGGLMSAFGDYTADKSTDIFMLSENRRIVQLIMAGKDSSFTQKKLISSSAADYGKIVSVMPGDFNGDAFMDILVTRKKASVKGYKVQIYWTVANEFIVNNSLVLDDLFAVEPLLLDYNGDMIPDLFAQSLDDNKRYFWVASTKGNFSKVEQELPPSSSLYPVRATHSNGFVELIGDDLNSDLFVDTLDTSNGQHQFEVWMRQQDDFVLNTTILRPKNSGNWLGQATFMDINGDSVMDIILPVCSDNTCKDSSIYAYVNDQWYLLVDSFVSHGTGWSFARAGTGNNLPVTLRAGDFDLDGFPDLLAVMRGVNDQNHIQKAFLLLNVECTAPKCRNIGRTFQAQFDSPLQTVTNVTAAAFYDIGGNGILDILVQTWDKEGTPAISAFRNTFSKDACFMKVNVISGRCYSDCIGGKPAFATNQPGIAIKYRTTGSDGKPQGSLAVQLSQSAHFALQTPSTIFGLGLTPNFVDGLRVGIPHRKDNSQTHEWTSIIPNSRLIVIPHPTDHPSRWINKLFVSPFANKQVIYTAGALLGTCIFVFGIIGALQWRERAEDKKEKLQDAQKFHFDAM